jgi:hypothetical protein
MDSKSTAQGEDAQRFLICALDSQMIQGTSTGGDFGLAGCGPGCTIQAVNITCLVCLPRYSITAGSVVMKQQTVTDVVIPENATSRQILGLSSWQMGMSIFQAVGSTPPPNFLGFSSEDLAQGNFGFVDVVKTTNPTAMNDFKTLFDATILRNISRQAFQSLGAQVALLHFMSLANESSVQVNYQALESRLRIQPAIFFVMEVLLLVLVTLSLLLASITAWNRIVPRDPSSILGLATIVARSPELISSLKGTGHISLQDLGRRLGPEKYMNTTTHARTSDSFKIDGRSSELDLTKETPATMPQSLTNITSWTPFSMKPTGSILLLVAPTVLIAIMLGLLLKSKHSQGISDLPKDSSLVHYGWTLIPAAVLLGLKVLFSTLDSALSTLQPFYVLSDRCPSREREVDVKDYNRLLTPQKLWYAIRYRHLAMASAALAAICAPFLTIVVSGLFRCVESLSFPLPLLLSSY